MKALVKQDELDELNKRVYSAGIKACFASTAVSSLAVLALNKSNAWFRNIRPSFKAAIWICPIVVTTVLYAEEQVVMMERERHSLHDAEGVLENKVIVEKNVSDDWKSWLADNRFALVASAWVVGVAGSLTYSYSNPYLTPTVKAFHARVQSQAITLGALIAAGAVAPFSSKTSNTSDIDMFSRRLAYEEKKWMVQHPGQDINEDLHKKK
eukprot:CFRG3553T1